jgi:hypothetical protein
VTLATDRARYAALRHKVETLRMSAPLFDTALWCVRVHLRARGLISGAGDRVREVEAAYAQMWRTHAAGAAPAAFHVSMPADAGEAGPAVPVPASQGPGPSWGSGDMRGY